ncbi:DOPA 4,5-dioxygenase family protein [Vibrio mexicanus]|uniref:DOPA 4,5-dioxygenase family protein n=1 Tax=Vibrio mexicanus TaxID=1004326 RepID=UPI00063CEA8E|nr:DOPA 4,5-dioxygenase family protein [Vibrio mexicanus]
MNQLQKPINVHRAYHAHIYFNQDTLALATELHHKIQSQFDLRLGRIITQPIGPHTQWSFQVLFTREDFERFIPWLDENRGSLNVLVHADTGNDLDDHTLYAYWLGDEVNLDLRGF